eukprot:1160901-Pelagomonas_calceolata.AAC.5
MLAGCRCKNITEYHGSLLKPRSTELMIVMELMACSVADLDRRSHWSGPYVPGSSSSSSSSRSSFPALSSFNAQLDFTAFRVTPSSVLLPLPTNKCTQGWQPEQRMSLWQHELVASKCGHHATEGGVIIWQLCWTRLKPCTFCMIAPGTWPAKSEAPCLGFHPLKMRSLKRALVDVYPCSDGGEMQSHQNIAANALLASVLMQCSVVMRWPEGLTCDCS